MNGDMQNRDKQGSASGAEIVRDRKNGYQGSVTQPSSLAESGLIDIWNLLWRRKVAIAAFALVGAIAGLLAAWIQPSAYQAKALVEIQDLNDNFLDMQQVAATTSGAGSQARTELQTQARILESRAVVEAAANRLASLASQGAVKPRVESGWPAVLSFVGREPATSAEAVEAREAEAIAIAIASRSLQVRSFDGSRVLEVLCDSTEPRIAAGFANAVVDEYISRSLRARWASARQTEEWLDRRLAESRANLEVAEDTLRAYIRERGLFVTPDQHRLEAERLGQFQQALSRAQEDRFARQSRHELAGKGHPEAIPEVLDDGALQGYRSKLVDLRRRYAELSSLYTDQHHLVKQVLAQIRTLEPILEQERGARIDRIHNEFEAAVRRERLLTEGYRKQKELVLRQADVAVDYNLLDRDAQTARQVYETLLQRVKEAGIASAMTASPAQIIDRAAPPALPYKPNAALSAAMGLLSGAFLGIVLVFVRDQADQRLRQPGDAALHLGIPELGVIYKSAQLAGAGLYRGSALVLRVAWHRDPAPASVTPTSTKPGIPRRIELGAWQRKQSRWSECFRAARTSVLFHGGAPGGTDRGGMRSLVVTSPSPGEGKTTVACNLAIAMAETGRRTLLVDADLRKPRLHEIFGFSGGRGLSDLLQEAEQPARLPLRTFLRETAVPGLSVLPSGALNSEGAALLHSERTVELLRNLEREFDLVVLDSPPLLPVSDGRVLARFADAAVLVVRLEQSTRDEAQLAAAQLQTDGSRLLGVVLNAWKPHAGMRGYYAGGYEYAPAAAESPKQTLAASA